MRVESSEFHVFKKRVGVMSHVRSSLKLAPLFVPVLISMRTPGAVHGLLQDQCDSQTTLM